MRAAETDELLQTECIRTAAITLSLSVSSKYQGTLQCSLCDAQHGWEEPAWGSAAHQQLTHRLKLHSLAKESVESVPELDHPSESS